MVAAKKRPAGKPERADRVSPGHEDFYTRLRERVTQWADRNEIKPTYREYLLALPDLFHLIARLVLDSRVDSVAKGILAVALAYCISPFDLLPDFLGPLGFVDDLLVVALAVETVLRRVPLRVVTDHWAGDDIVLLVREIRAAADTWVGRGMYLRIRAFLTEHGIGKDVGVTDVPQAGKRAPRRKAAAKPTEPTPPARARKATGAKPKAARGKRASGART